VREIIVFAVLNGIGLLIQDATVEFSYYVGHAARGLVTTKRKATAASPRTPQSGTARPRSLASARRPGVSWG